MVGTFLRTAVGLIPTAVFLRCVTVQQVNRAGRTHARADGSKSSVQMKGSKADQP